VTPPVLHALSRASISNRILWATTIAVGSALIVTAAALLLWDRYIFLQEAAEELGTASRVMADSLQAPVSFDDASAANETLAFLASMPEVESGCVYDDEGRLFANYPVTSARVCASQFAEGAVARTGELISQAPIVRQGRHIGNIELRRAVRDVDRRLFERSIFLMLVAAASLGVGLVLSNRIRQSIADPIAHLAEAAQRVSRSRDYSLRAERNSDGEIGVLVDSFNEMLARIELQTADLEEASRLKDEFLAKLSHELRTPLNAVLGWAHMLRNDEVPKDKFRMGLDSIERNSGAQLRIIEDLLDISRIATGKLVIEKQPLDVRDVVKAAVEVVQLSADAKQIAIVVNEPSEPAVVLGDASRLQQMIWNLLTNSIKFTPTHGEIVVRVAADTRAVFVSVVDNGEGMAAEFVPFAFDPFRQARPSSSGGGGLGLGLSLVKQIAELHGGKARVEQSAPLKGTSIMVDLPRWAELSVQPSSEDLSRRYQ
jgi:signal transduction histidine kinase